MNDAITVYIGLGSNLGGDAASPLLQIKSARQAINALDFVSEGTFSSLYRSPPMGPQDQPDYINAVMGISTQLSALDLLVQLQAIELYQGRERKEVRWGARTLDLDILLYADQCIDLPNLMIPHYGMTERAFVLYPLYEIAPDLMIPNKGHLADLIKQCPLNGLEKIV